VLVPDDFVWCAASFADIEGVLSTVAKVTEKTKVLAFGSSLMRELFIHMNQHSQSYQKAHFEAFFIETQGLHTKAYNGTHCRQKVSIKEVVEAIAKRRPDVVWLEESIHAYQKLDSRSWLSHIDSVMSAIRSVFKGRIVWRGLTPYALLQCSTSTLPKSVLFYAVSSLARLKKLDEGSKLIAAKHRANVVDLFELAAGRPELAKDSPHYNPLHQCWPRNAKPEPFGGAELERKGAPCPQEHCKNYADGCHPGGVALNPRTVMEYMLASYLHHSIHGVMPNAGLS